MNLMFFWFNTTEILSPNSDFRHKNQKYLKYFLLSYAEVALNPTFYMPDKQQLKFLIKNST